MILFLKKIIWDFDGLWFDIGNKNNLYFTLKLNSNDLYNKSHINLFELSKVVKLSKKYSTEKLHGTKNKESVERKVKYNLRFRGLCFLDN